MTSIEQTHRNTPRPATIAVVVANILPLVGVVGLGWNVVALVFLYWLELGLMCFWALVRALFAGRPSELDHRNVIVGALVSKAVEIPIPRTGLRVHVSTLPVLGVAIPVLTLVWFFAGAMTVGSLGAEKPNPETMATVTLAAFGIFISEGMRTAIEYFYRQGYREHSAQTAIQGVFIRGAIIGLGGMFTVTIVGLAMDSVATDDPLTAIDPTTIGIYILTGIVLVKFGFDLAELYRDRLVAFDESMSLEIGWAYEPPIEDSVEPVPTDPKYQLRPSVLGRSIGGVSTVRRHPGTWFISVFLLLLAALFATGRVWNVTTAFALASVVIPLLLVNVDYWLRYGGVEYLVTDGAVVAYDRLFRTPLWRVEPWDETELRIERDRIDMWLDTSTVVIERSDRELRLPRLRTVDPVLNVFERRAIVPGE